MRLTLVGFADLVFSLKFLCMLHFLNSKRDFHFGIHADITIAHQMHYERVLTRMWWSLELCFESLNVEGRFAGFVKNGLVKCGKCEWRNSHSTLLAVCKENEPTRGMVSWKIRSVRKRRGDRLIIGGCCFDVSIGIFCLDCLFAAKNGVEIILVRVNVFQINFVDFWNFCRTRRNKPRLNDELY